MTVRRVIGASLGLLLVGVILVVWVIPIAQGPHVECTGIEPAACEAEWRALAADAGGPELFPVTRVSVSEGGKCPSVYVERLWGVFAVISQC